MVSFSLNLNGVEYYYIRNAQNDIIGIFDKEGTKVVSYTYDSWGKLISIDGDLASTVGLKNPYRYRGYRYDTETGLYYLQSRYYNPEWGRFLNADAQLNPGTGLVGFNMFTYCNNNPVNMEDPSGYAPFLLVTAAIGAVVCAVVGGVAAAKAGKNVWAGVGIGAAAGGLIGLGAGAAAGAMLAGSATASTVAVVAGGKAIISGAVAVGGSSVAINKVATEKSVVIGETMNRVMPYAQKIGAETYNGLTNYVNIANKIGEPAAKTLGAFHNAGWIISKMVQNYRIVDIGVDITRNSRSFYYGMERVLTFFY